MTPYASTTGFCPTCGAHCRRIEGGNAGALLELLTNGTPHRQVYAGRDGGWFVTHGGGEVSADDVRALVQNGAVKSVYSDCPKDCYHVGPTLDTARTLELRKKFRHGRDAPAIFVGDPPHPKENSVSESEKR